jgi:hypothetical protein
VGKFMGKSVASPREACNVHSIVVIVTIAFTENFICLMWGMFFDALQN